MKREIQCCVICNFELYLLYQTLNLSIMETTFYDFSAKDIHGKEIDMDAYKGKTVLVVNTASKCGFTPQFEGLENLYIKYSDKGLVILGFPCNQFANQEPGDEKSIIEGCLLNYGVTFPMFSKIEVNGPDAHPLFKYLRSQLPNTIGNRIRWNFTKFLINAEGKPVKRFSSATKPEKIDAYLQKTIFK